VLFRDEAHGESAVGYALCSLILLHLRALAMCVE
jgi:hypothetical protein